MTRAAAGLVFTALAPVAVAAPLTEPADLDAYAPTIVGFDTLPDDGVITHEMDLSEAYADLGVVFSCEGTPNLLQTTDPADASGRFDQPCRFLNAVGGGGSPLSAPFYVGGHAYLGWETSDFRLDFPEPVDAVGAWFIDHDFSDLRVSAYATDGTLLEENVLPRVAEGGSEFHGIAAPDIAYVIVDAVDGADLDSTFIDDLMFGWGEDPGPTLTVEGLCPGPSTIRVENVTPGGAVRLIAGSDLGSFVGARGPCPGVDIGIVPPLTMAGPAFNDRDDDGVLEFTPDLPAPSCGRPLVAVDVTTCTVSAPASL